MLTVKSHNNIKMKVENKNRYFYHITAINHKKKIHEKIIFKKFRSLENQLKIFIYLHMN